MKFAHLNIRSLLKSFYDFSLLIRSNDYDVVMVTETWLTNNIPDQVVNIPGYDLYRFDRQHGRGGGVCAYAKQALSARLVTFDFQISPLLENIFIKISLNTRTLIVGGFYRPPNSNANNFISDFDSILSYVCPIFDHVIIMGDLNVNFFNLNTPISDCFESYGLLQILNEPTRITDSTSTLIDPIFVNNPDLVDSVGTILTDDISDHNLVHVTLNLKSFKPRHKIVKYRCYNNFNYQAFLTDLQGLDWNAILRTQNIDSKIGMFNEMLLGLFNNHAPVKEVRITKPRAPWLTDEIKQAKKQKLKALQKYKRERTDDSRNRYKQLRNQTVSLVRRAKKQYLENICAENNSFKTWNTLRDLNVRTNKNHCLPSHLSNPDNINNYFSSFLQGVSNKGHNGIQFYNNTKYRESLDFNCKLTSLEHINETLNAIKTNCCGTDNISINMLKYCSPFIDVYILNIINSCIEQKYFPDSWKTAIGKPLAKNNNPKNFSDLRVISILPAMSKILEKILHDQMYSFFMDNQLIPDNQCGFRKNFNTATALTSVIDDIIAAYDKGQASLLVLLDFSKAFDTLDHKLLLSKLHYYGFDKDSVDLISSFLNNRSQKIVVDQAHSNTINILSGVPQGSILSPLLFIIYTAEILKSTQFCQSAAYADDTQLYFSFNMPDCLQAALNINTDLETIRSLSDTHNLKLNSEKSKLLCIANKANRDIIKANVNIYVGNVRLTYVNSVKNLGIVLDEELRFKEHVKNMNKKAFYSLKVIYNNRHILDRKLKRLLCDSLVLSHYAYCDFVFMPCLLEIERNRIQKMQNSCCRLIYGVRRREHISHKINECNWLTMRNRCNHHLGNFVHKLLVLPNTSGKLKNKLVTRVNIHDRNIRYKNRFTMPHYKTSLFQRSFTYNAIKFYNSLPDEFKSYSVNKFKFRLRAYLFSKQ